MSTTPRTGPLRATRALVVVLATMLAGIAIGLGLSPSVAQSSPRAPHRISGNVITDVRGNAADGFAIHHLDGRIDYPETRSEALAECLGYATLRARARCHGELTQWYTDLTQLQHTIRYYQRLFG